jgi:hypothetical protein
VTRERRTLSHDDEHARVASDVDAYRAMPVVARNRRARAERYKKAYWAVCWHLRKSHGWRHLVGPPLDLDEVEAIHARYHAKENR